MGTYAGQLTPAAPLPDEVTSADPWFRRRPRLALLLAAVMFAAILALRISVGTTGDASSLLFVFPVALVATAFGVRAGACAGVLAIVLIGVWAVAQDVSLSPLGWASRALPLLLLGTLLGHATERMRRAEQERRQLQAAALLHRDAIEVNDSLVQGMAAAKWSLESGRLEDGLQTLDETLAQAHELVSQLIREASMGDQSTSLRPRNGPLT